MTTTNIEPAAEPLEAIDASLRMAEAMEQLLTRMERLEARLARFDAIVDEVPGALATVTDIADGLIQDAARHGIDTDERLKLGLVAVERLTTPENLRALTGLSEQLSTLNALAQQAPGMMAMTVDMIDELYRSIDRQGINLEETAREGLAALRNFMLLLRSEEMKALLDSGMLAPRTLAVMGAAAEALVVTQQNVRPAGPLTLLRALFDRNIQRALGFGLGFAERFGRNLPNTGA
jgi:uncharacterized protein YjgD (DUF1641 family)